MDRLEVHASLKYSARLINDRFSYSQWSTEVDFRASGQEHGAGNLQIWYTKENQQEIGSNSLYTVGKFEGLVLVVDGQGGERVCGGAHNRLYTWINDDFREAVYGAS